MSGSIIGVLSVLTGAACLGISRSRWFRWRLEEKHKDHEDAEDRIKKNLRDWNWISLFWFAFGLSQILMT